MFKKYTCFEMDDMIVLASDFLERTDIIGFAVARNTRILRNEITEYLNRKEQLINRYGTHIIDENGNDTGTIRIGPDSPNFNDYVEDLKVWGETKHSPNIYKIPYSSVIGILSGNDILKIDWMLKDDDPVENSEETIQQ